MIHPLITLENVTVGRDPPRLRDVSWRLGRGECWAIVGPNGAGKSTLLHVLRGVVPRSTGTVRYDVPEDPDVPVSDPRQRVVQVSFDLQNALLKGSAGYAQSRWHSGQDAAVARGRELLGPDAAGGTTRGIVRSLGLDDVLDRRVSELSNGERRKLLLARAAARRPAVLALDNPFSGLDDASRGALSVGLRELQRSGMTVVVATCRVEEVDPAVTHVLLLVEGRVVAAGPRAEVVSGEPFESVMGSERGAAKAPSEPFPSAGAGAPPVADLEEGDGPPVVALRGVGVRYGDVRLLRDVSWTVRRGERWVLLGPNGAGKSTLLSLVLTDNPQAYANDVSLFGRRRGTRDSIWEIRRRLGCVSPELHLYHGRRETALEVVGSGLRDSIGLARPLSPAEAERARSWLERLGQGDLAARPFGDLSEGEQQMALLARAMVKEPELLVLDEPCQGLDASSRRRFLEVLRAHVADADATLVHATHDPGEVRGLATHALMLEGGRVARAGPLE